MDFRGGPIGDSWLRLGPAAAHLGVSPNALRQWADSGRIACSRTPGGHRRFRVADLDGLLASGSTSQTGLPAPPLRHDPSSCEPALQQLALPQTAPSVPAPAPSVVLGDLIDLMADVPTEDESAAERFFSAALAGLSGLLPGAHIELYAGDGTHLRRRAATGERLSASEHGDRLLAPEHPSITAHALATGRLLYAASEDDPRLTADERRALVEHGGTALVATPLTHAGRPVGFLRILAPAGLDLTSSLEPIATVGRLVARILADAEAGRVSSARMEQARWLADIARRLASSLDVHDIAATSLQVTGHLFPCPSAAIVLDGPDGHPLAVAARYGQGGPSLHDLPLTDRRAILDVPLPQDGAPTSVHPNELPAALRPLLGHSRLIAGALVASEHHRLGLLVLALPAGDLDEERRHLFTHLTAQVAHAIAGAGRFHDIRRFHLENLRALNSALGARDAYSVGHAARVAAYMMLLADELQWSDRLTRHLAEAAYLHDIGKLGIDERVLLSTSLLSSRDWESVYRHPALAAEILEPVFEPDLVAGVRHHHERWDGTGYPDGLSGSRIPRVARAMAVVDAYDAMSCRRPYRDPLQYDDCRRELLSCRGSQFDPRMADAFLGILHRLDGLRSVAGAAATYAADRMDPATSTDAVAHEDPLASSRRAVAAVLREAVDGRAPDAQAATLTRLDGETKIVATVSETASDGNLSFPMDPLPAADLDVWWSGRRLDQNVICVEAHRPWVTAIAPVPAEDGSVAALVSVALPAGPPISAVPPADAPLRSFAAMLHTTAERLGRARRESITDHLTGLYNHRYLHERLSEELERARETGTSLSLLFLDLDRFKQFNDRYGHSMGDRALRTVADAIHATVRGLDLAARYGGEEFIVILVDTDGEGALDAAERLRKAVSQTEIAEGVEHVTVSIGIATFPDDAERKEGLIDKADWAMYAAKRGGRDRVRSFSSGQLRLDLGDTGSAHEDGPRPGPPRPAAD